MLEEPDEATWQAYKKVVRALEPLRPVQRFRVIRAAAMLLGVDEEERRLAEAWAARLTHAQLWRRTDGT